MATFPNIEPLPTHQLSSSEGGMLQLRRVLFPDTPKSHGTPGVLYYRPSPTSPWQYVAQTLERPDGVYNGVKGRIPPGTYPLSLAWSKKQSESKWSQDPRRPLLHGVKGRTGIQIHAGSGVGSSRGCILVGHFDRGLYHLNWDDSKETFKEVRNLWKGNSPSNPQAIQIVGIDASSPEE